MKIKITTGINPDGILNVTAKDSYNNENSLNIKTIRNDNIEQYSTILPHEIYEEEYELLNNVYQNMKQQVLFQLEENIFLKISHDEKQSQLNIFNEYNNKIEPLLNTYVNNKNIKLLEENIIEIKKICLNVQNNFSIYLNNYSSLEENNSTQDNNWMEKLENVVNRINNYNLSKIEENKILDLVEQIINLDNQDCELLYISISEIIGFKF